MTFLPIVERELRVAARRRSTYISRCSSAVGALLVGGWMMLAMQTQPPQIVGKSLFYTIGVLVMISAISGLRATADCLSEEKRDGTLGLLFLTDLKGYDVVFGKLVSSSINSFYAMLSIFPILAISLLLGGVTYSEFWRVALTSANLLFLSLAIGMFCSAVCRDERKALALATLTMFLLLGLFPVIGAVIAFRVNSYPEPLLLPSPAYGAFLSFDVLFRGHVREFWMNTAVTNLYAWCFLTLACRIVPRSWQDKSASAKRQEIESGWKKITQGNAAERNAYRTESLNINPFLWLAARDRFKNKLVWLVLAAAGLFWMWGWAEFKKDWINIGTYVITALILHTTLKIWLATEGCKRFVEDRRNGAMELLLSTPLSVSEIFRGQRLALLRQFGGPAILILVADFILMFAGLSEVRSEKDLWIAVWLVGGAMLVIDLYAMSWVAIWMGSTMHRTNRAAGGVISRILAVPWLTFSLLLTGVSLIDEILGLRWLRRMNLPEVFIPIFWFVLGALNNWFWTAQAKRNLQRRFREIATERFSPPPSLFERIFHGKKNAAAN